MRPARAVSALVFGTAAASVTGVVLGGWSDGWGILRAVLVFAAPASLLGFLAGPKIASAPNAAVAALWGAMLAIATGVLVLVVLTVIDALLHPVPAQDVSADSIDSTGWMLLLFAAFIVTPFGGAAGWVVWRWFYDPTATSYSAADRRRRRYS